MRWAASRSMQYAGSFSKTDVKIFVRASEMLSGLTHAGRSGSLFQRSATNPKLTAIQRLSYPHTSFQIEEVYMFNKFRKGVGFVAFVVGNIRPRPLAFLLIVIKLIHKLLAVQPKNISFTFLSHTPLQIKVNDVEQLSYFFNIFYSEPFKITKTIDSSPIIIDGGANIGMSSLYYYSKYPRARIYAIEPVAENVDLLRSNLSGLPYIDISQIALWEESKELILNISSCVRYNSVLNIDEKCRPRRVKALSLSDWLDEKHIVKVDVLKLNVEGAEVSAIKGLGKRIKEVGVIVGEFHSELVDKDEFFSELERNNFTISRFEKMGKTTWSFEAHNGSFL